MADVLAGSTTSAPPSNNSTDHKVYLAAEVNTIVSKMVEAATKERPNNLKSFLGESLRKKSLS